MLRLESIRFSVSPRDIRLSNGEQLIDLDEKLRLAEKTGFEKGLVEGERALSEQLLQQRSDLLELHKAAVVALQQSVPEMVRQLEDSMIELSLEIARKLVGDSPITKECVASAVREALEQVEDTTVFTVSLHPSDLELLGSEPTTDLNAASFGQQMRFVSSPEVTRGGCLVQTRFGSIDTRRETKLRRIASTLGLQ